MIRPDVVMPIVYSYIANEGILWSANFGLFPGAEQRTVAFQNIYPAKAPGTFAACVPNSEPVIDAIAISHSWKSRIVLEQIGTLAARWTAIEVPAAGGQFLVEIATIGPKVR